MYVRALHIENIRSFENAKVDLQFPTREQNTAPSLPNVNLLLGNNGAGKTTVLKAIALAVLGRILPGSGYVPYNLIRRDRAKSDSPAIKKALAGVDLILHPEDLKSAPLFHSFLEGSGLRSSVSISLRGSQEELEPSFDDLLTQGLFEDNSAAFLLVGYGATRYALGASDYEPISSQRKRRRLRYQRVAGLFEEHLGLAPVVSWLPGLRNGDPTRCKEVVALLNELLPGEARFLERLEDDEYLFEHCGIAVPLAALSDGYRAYIGWISDLLYNISLGAPEGTRLRDARGVVLVDEIDLHLHPEWQREVVPTIARALPNLQFVLTTHSPIVAGTLSAQNIFTLEMDGAGASTIRQLEEPIQGLSADQILLSPYFNLESTRSQESLKEFLQLSKKAMAGDSEAAVAFLKKITSGTEPAIEKKPASRKAPARPRRTKAK